MHIKHCVEQPHHSRAEPKDQRHLTGSPGLAELKVDRPEVLPQAQQAEAEARERAEAMAKQMEAASDEDGVRFCLLFEQLTEKVDAMRELADTMREKGKADQAGKFMGALCGALADVLADLEGGAA